MITEFSNPNLVGKIGKKYGIDVYISSRKDKKYMVLVNDKWIHFGQMGYQDYTKHKNKKKRELFRKRNHKWADASMYSPAWLSYYLLW